jgi:hypothetical protein
MRGWWLVTLATVAAAPPAVAQVIPGQKVGGTPNIHVVAHVPIRGFLQVGDIDVEQEMSRPFVYISRLRLITNEAGFTIVNIKDPSKAEVLYNWRIENSELHEMGMGGLGVKYFKLNHRYYLVNAFQFGQSGPNADLGAVVFDVTGLPDTTKVKEVGRLRVPEYINGFHNVFTYKHSDGRVLVFAAFAGLNPSVYVYDMGKFLAGDPQQGLIGKVPLPEGTEIVRGNFTGNTPPAALNRGLAGYHDMYVGYDPVTHQDKFYGPGAGGFYVYDVTHPEEPKLLTSINGVAGVSFGHTFTPTPDGRYVVAETEYQSAPLRIFDLKPGLEGKNPITRPIGAWTVDWRDLVHNTEVRWPYVFVTGYEDGFQVFNMMDPTNPYTVGYYYTCNCAHESGWTSNRQAPRGKTIFNGSLALDIRNADGLVVMTDWETGFWAFKMDGFDGWNGHQWGMPNISSAQDWDHGPEGAPPPQPSKVSSR